MTGFNRLPTYLEVAKYYYSIQEVRRTLTRGKLPISVNKVRRTWAVRPPDFQRGFFGIWPLRVTIKSVQTGSCLTQRR